MNASAQNEMERLVRVNREQQNLLDQIYQYVDEQGLAKLGQSRVEALIEAHKRAEKERKMSNYKLVAGGPLHPSQVRALRRNVKRNCPPEIYALLDQAIAAQQPGLTKLEDFTKAALHGLLANPDLTHIPPVDAGHKATIYAEAALAELEKRNA